MEVDLLTLTKKIYYDTLTTGAGGTRKKPPTSVSHVKLVCYKLYLDSCVTYHTTFVDWYLSNIHKVDIGLKGHCNAGVTISN